MPNIFIRDHSGDYSRSADGRTATAAWTAFDPANPGLFATEKDVRTHAEFPVSINAEWPDDPTEPLKCESYSIRRVGRSRMWRVEAQWSQPPDGGEHTGGAGPSDDPTAAPIEYQWDTVELSEAIDRDAEGNPIVNTAGQGFRNPIPRGFNAKRLTITRNVASYTVATSLAYENRVNGDSFLGAQPQEVRCIEVSPATVYTASSTYIRLRMVFEFRDIEVFGDYPHQPRIKNQGVMARASVDGETKLVRICTATGDPVTEDVPLKADGTPKDETLTYLDASGNPVDSPEWVTHGLQGSHVIVEDAGDVIFLRYIKVYPETSFGGLGV